MVQQLSLLSEHISSSPKNDSRSGTFTDNMKLPVHRWFRYSAGFSAEWVQSVIQEQSPSCVLDPFAGSGTTLLASAQCNVDAYGFESHPFISRIASAKLLWGYSTDEINRFTQKIINRAAKEKVSICKEPDLLLKCYDAKSLTELCALRNAFIKIKETATPQAASIIWLAITGILRSCSSVGTAQWQYVLPNKTKSKVQQPIQAFTDKIYEITTDMLNFQLRNYSRNTTIFQHDARECCPCLENKIDLVITSPPYPNNYDYADATRLEMCFWGEIKKWGDLQHAVRKHIIRSCSQHAAADKIDLDDILSEPLLSPILDDLASICKQLEVVRHQHGGKKAYHLMVAGYFADLARIFCVLRKCCKQGAAMCFVVGDSAPYSVYVPVDNLLGRLAVGAGFSDFSFKKIRDRNIKWKNRKHTVPLQEGRLWIRG